MNFYRQKYKNSYLIYVLLKNSIFFLFWKIQKYEFYVWVYFKGWTKSEDGKLFGTKSWRNFLEGLKQKVDTFIGSKTYLTLKWMNIVIFSK